MYAIPGGNYMSYKISLISLVGQWTGKSNEKFSILTTIIKNQLNSKLCPIQPKLNNTFMIFNTAYLSVLYFLLFQIGQFYVSLLFFIFIKYKT